MSTACPAFFPQSAEPKQEQTEVKQKSCTSTCRVLTPPTSAAQNPRRDPTAQQLSSQTKRPEKKDTEKAREMPDPNSNRRANFGSPPKWQTQFSTSPLSKRGGGANTGIFNNSKKERPHPAPRSAGTGDKDRAAVSPKAWSRTASETCGPPPSN